MTTNYYWFDPKTQEFYGPGVYSHAAIISSNHILSKILDNITDKQDDKIEKLLENNWVRLYFNQDNNELGISCRKIKDAYKTIRNFIKTECFEIKSLFLDIKDASIQNRISEENIDLFIKRGRLNLIEF